MSLELIKNDHRSASVNWKRELASAISSPDELCRLLNLDPAAIQCSEEPSFRLRVTHSYVAKMRPGDPNDPLLLQVLPRQQEYSNSGLLDPVGDLDAMTSTGLLHKYHGRVLLITTGACAIHCRYCFRRNFPYQDSTLSSSHTRAALDYIQAHSEIQEVILSGGDPLVLDNHKLDALQQAISNITHVKYLRIHTRLPIVLPSRIDAALLHWMQNSRLRITMVIHANHANEIGPHEVKMLTRLRDAGVTLLNQSVLLRQVNDNAEALIQLSYQLHEAGVMPYYLHLLDPTRGAMHFDVSQAEAAEIMKEMRARLPGYLLPRLVREEAGKNSKTAIFSI